MAGGGGPYIQQQPHHVRLAAEGRFVQRRARLGLPVDVDASLQQEPAGRQRGQRGGEGWGGDTSPALPAHGTHRMMSMWPFLAARCRGLVPLGSVASPGLGSSSAAHMLLFRSSWTTWLSKHRRSRAARAAQPPVGAAAPPQPLPPLPQQPGIPHSGGTEGPPAIPPGGCPVSLPVLLQHPRDPAVPPHPLPSCLSRGGSQHCKDLPQPGQTRTPGPGASSPNCP